MLQLNRKKGVTSAKYKRYNIDKYKERIWAKEFRINWKNKESDFTRNRKVKIQDIVNFNLNNRGKTLKMELYDYEQEFELEKISSPGMLKQRLKLNPNGIKYLAVESMKDFYNMFTQEVKTFKGYVLTAIDGSDCEVPNTKETRERYKSINSTVEDRVARIKLSNCYDVLNKYVLDTQVAEYKHFEIDLAKKHIENTKYIEKFQKIYTMDRGYFSLSTFYQWIKQDIKFVVRLNKKYLKTEQESMTSDDEIVEIKYQYDRIRNYKDKDVVLV